MTCIDEEADAFYSWLPTTVCSSPPPTHLESTTSEANKNGSESGIDTAAVAAPDVIADIHSACKSTATAIA